MLCFSETPISAREMLCGRKVHGVAHASRRRGFCVSDDDMFVLHITDDRRLHPVVQYMYT